MKRSIILISTVSAVLMAVYMICSCKSGVANDDDVLQITADDVTHLDGTFEDNFMESWEYILLEDDANETIIPGTVLEVKYDDGLYFIQSRHGYNSIFKVFDSTGHYLNDISHIGRARNEYVFIHDWILERNKNEVFLVTSAGYNSPVEIKRFDYKGNYLGQLVSDTLDNVHYLSHVSKFMPDGSLLLRGSLSLYPMYDYFYIHPDGHISEPMDKLGYHMMVDEDKIDEEISYAVSTMGQIPSHFVTKEILNQNADTTYLMRMLDNHIYKIWADSSECVANLTFLPSLPEKKKYNFTFDDDDVDIIPNYFIDFKDYVQVWYCNIGEFLYEKSTSKVYHLDRDTMYAYFPDHRVSAAYGNDIIAWVDVEDIPIRLAEMDSPEYNHHYSPEVEDFYRKARNCENPPIIIAHYKKQFED